MNATTSHVRLVPLDSNPLESDHVDAVTFLPCMGGRFARRLRSFIVARVQAITEWNLWGGRIALWGYHSPDVMRSDGMSWWISVDRSYEMVAGIVAQIVVMGESLCIWSSPNMAHRRHVAMVAGLRKSMPWADADAVSKAVDDALRDAASSAANAAREAGGSRFWRSRPAGW